MSLFINPAGRVAITTDDGRHTIYIRERESMRVSAEVAASFQAIGGNAQRAYDAAQLRHNIVAWSGPEFDGVPCTPENVDRMDPRHPVWGELMPRALAAIRDQNTPREEMPERPEPPDPNG